MKKRGFLGPVLVGGAAVEIYSPSAINTGDFDISTPVQDVFEEELQRHGFIRPSGPGMATRGWIHPGRAERERVELLEFAPDGEVAVISVEDIIADRMGQFASGTAPDMREQARRLFILHNQADISYMDKRIRYESGGDYGVADLKD